MQNDNDNNAIKLCLSFVDVLHDVKKRNALCGDHVHPSVTSYLPAIKLFFFYGNRVRDFFLQNAVEHARVS